MTEIYSSTLNKMAICFDTLSQLVHAPVEKDFGMGSCYRYDDRSLQQAIIQKLARIPSNLKSIHLLNSSGLIQDQASLQRVNDELNEDIIFLAFPLIFDDITDLHVRYLDAFFYDEHDPEASSLITGKERPTIPRKKIRAYNNIDRGAGDQSTGINCSKSLQDTYSGYVHAVSPQLMEMYYGNPPRFHINHNMDSPLYNDHVEDMINYFYRSVVSFIFCASAFRCSSVHSTMYELSKSYNITSKYVFDFHHEYTP